MPTLEPHQIRHVAESFGTNADRYDRARPRYPDGLIARIAETSPGPEVLDVGCGTGIASRQLQAAGCTVLGVEPDARMAEFARQRGLDVEIGKIEDWDAKGRTFDALTAGQCWHWVDPGAGAAKAAHVLRPGGLMAAFWNVDQPPPELAEVFKEIWRRILPESFSAQIAKADPYAVMTGRTADGIRAAGQFSEPAEWRFSWEREYTKQEWLYRLPTHGGMNTFSPDQVAEVLAMTGEAIDAAGGSFTMTYSTVAITATRN